MVPCFLLWASWDTRINIFYFIFTSRLTVCFSWDLLLKGSVNVTRPLSLCWWHLLVFIATWSVCYTVEINDLIYSTCLVCMLHLTNVDFSFLMFCSCCLELSSPFSLFLNVTGVYRWLYKLFITVPTSVRSEMSSYTLLWVYYDGFFCLKRNNKNSSVVFLDGVY